MTPLQKQLIEGLLQGMYLLPKVRHDGKPMLKLYRDNMVPVRYYSLKTVASIRELSQHEILKKDKKQRITLHLGNVRRMHGGTWLKQQYKSKRNNHEGK